MILTCAEKIKEKAEYELKIIEEAKKYIQIEKFIDTEKIEVCLMPNEDIHKQQNLNKEELTLPLLINETKNCGIHNSNEKSPNHISYIRDFISKFSSKIYGKDRTVKLKLSKLFREEIERGIR